MLHAASSLLTRARQRLHAARTHDPHAWHDAQGALLVDTAAAGRPEPVPDRPPEATHPEATGSEGTGSEGTGSEGTGSVGTGPVGTAAPAAGGSSRPPLGSPEPGAPDLDGPLAPGGVSGPPEGDGQPASRAHRPRGRRPAVAAVHPGGHGGGEATVPPALRTAASWSWRLIVVLAGLYALLWVAARVHVVLVPVIVALLLAALLQPGAALLVRHRWPPSLAALAMLVVGLGVVSGIITLVVERITAGLGDLTDQVSEGIGQVQAFLVRTFPITRGQLEDAVTQVQDTLVANQDTLASGALTTAATVGEVFAGVALALFTLFFFLKDGRGIWLWLVGLLPRESQAYVDEAARRSWRTLISYVRATAVVALFDAVFIGVGLAVLGVPLVVPLAALVFLGAFVPIIGSFLAGTVAVLVALVSQGPITALIALGIITGVMQLEGHVLQPLLLGRAVRVHPLAVVLAIAAGLIVAGIFGALIAVPAVACANVAGTYLSRRHQGPRPPEPRPERAPSVVATG